MLELPGLVADLGYEHIELSPREDFIPFFKHPRVDSATIKAFKGALSGAGVEVSSLLPLFRWSGPDEDERQAAVRYWKRSIQIAVELGVDVMNSEFNGRPEQSSLSEAQFWRSMEELLPIFEREGIRLALEPHPDDFVEDGVTGREHGPRHELVRGVVRLLRAAHVPPGREPGRDHRYSRRPPDARACRRLVRSPRVFRAALHP